MPGKREEQLSFMWKTPRPAYMREIEPLAHDDAWPSPLPRAGTEEPLLTPEQESNRELFSQGRPRKQAAGVTLSGNERKTG